MSEAMINGRRHLDAAARILRERTTPASRFYPLAHGGAGQASLPADASGMALPFTERLSRMADSGQAQVGDMPPQPNTFRARVGAVLVGVMRRALFWYTGQIRTAHKNIADAAREQVRALRELDAAVRRQQAALAEKDQKFEDVDSLAERLQEFEREIAALGGRIERIEQEQRRHAEAVLQRLHRIEQTVAAR